LPTAIHIKDTTAPGWKEAITKRREWFAATIKEQTNRDPKFPEKLQRAREKARKFALKLFGPIRRGWVHNYWKIEKSFVNRECGINWWLTPPELYPEVIFD